MSDKKEDPAVVYLNNKFKHIPCEHEWTYDGHGHNDNHYVCHKCGSGGDY